MKQFDPIVKTLSGNKFYIRPFGAFTSANLSGEIISLVVPVLSAAAPLIGNATGNGADTSLLDIDSEVAAPILANAAAGISGDRLEALLKKLLIKHGNISVELEGERDAQNLTEDLADEVFCGETQDMFILAFEVIKVNYSGFFEKLAFPFGERVNALLQKPQPN